MPVIVYNRKRLRENSIHEPTVSRPPPVAPRVKKRARRTLTQLHLDMGQRQVGANHCQQCDMIFSPGTFDDVVHRRHHLRCARRPRWGARLMGEVGVRLLRKAVFEGGIVGVCVRDGCEYVRKRVYEIDDWINAVLNAVDGLSIRAVTSGVFVVMLVADGFVSAYAALEADIEGVVRASVARDGVTSVIGKAPQEARPLWGVRKIWVHQRFRRRGVATMLLDAGRAALLQGKDAIGKVAFSATSLAGALFAKRYAKTQAHFHQHDDADILIYGMSK